MSLPTPISPTLAVPSRPQPARKPSVKFREDCMYIDSKLPTSSDGGIKRRLSPLASTRDGNKETTSLGKRLSLSLLSTPPKPRLPRKWSHGPSPVSPSTKSSSSSSPKISTKSISSPISLPTTPTSFDGVDYSVLHKIKNEIDIRPTPIVVQSAQRSPGSPPPGVVLPAASQSPETPGLFASSTRGSLLTSSPTGSSIDTTTPADTGAPRSRDALDNITDETVRSVVVSRPVLHLAPAIAGLPVPRRSTTLPLNASCSDLDILHEHDEAVKHSCGAQQSSNQGIWLCSRPRSPASPISPPAASLPRTVPMTRSQSGVSIHTALEAGATPLMRPSRPFVTRSMSTGRLAHEFDDEGRVVCLSVHSDRVLQDKQANFRFDPHTATPRATPSSPPPPPPPPPLSRPSSSVRAVPSSPSGAGATISRATSRSHNLLDRLGSPKDETSMSNKERKGYFAMRG